MELARITSKGQMTIPKRVRDAVQLSSGDLVVVAVEDDRITIRKVVGKADDYLRSVQATLTEWDSPEDEEAWREL